jgi:hypothetical protein
MKKKFSLHDNKVTNSLKDLSLKQWIIVALVALLLSTQVASFVKKGELLGVKVRESNSGQNKGLRGAENARRDESDKSSVCKKVSDSFVSELVGKEVRKGAISADIGGSSNLVSSCIYTTDPAKDKGVDSRSVTVSLKVTDNEGSAKDLFKNLKETNTSATEEVNSLGDEAFYTPRLNRLTVRSSKSFVNVFVKAGSPDSLDELDVAKKIAEKLL